VGIAVLRKVQVKAVFDVKPTSNVGNVFQPEFEGNILSQKVTCSVPVRTKLMILILCGCITIFLT
jgi:hypothetical protein